MSRHSSRLAIQSPPIPRNGLSFSLAYAGAALIAPRSRPSAWNRVLRPLTLALWVPLALAAWCVPMAHAAGPLPQGGAFVRGQGAMTSGTTSLTIDQSSSRGVIDWHSFSIGNGNTVAFNNGSGATLNPAPTLFIWIVRTAITYIDCISLAPGAWGLGPGASISIRSKSAHLILARLQVSSGCMRAARPCSSSRIDSLGDGAEAGGISSLDINSIWSIYKQSDC
ncbi:hypothetical protein [Paraburkholderia tuberum]|uniref:Haemagglutination activity domain-containing protein n=1 Tax=Paraburkholderia tuberum TaxID=157910 RepID=A0A1H1JGN4_9BURK|nr:haemagglutination activity domain-containing protein [Paraburkholderia tuberum]